jgi:hypothetical protein
MDESHGLVVKPGLSFGGPARGVERGVCGEKLVEEQPMDVKTMVEKEKMLHSQSTNC